jgi:hypothetical protein
VLVGVRKESKSVHERRVPIVPEAMVELMAVTHTCPSGKHEKKIKFCIQPAEGQRVIPAEEFKKVGVEVNSSLSHCDFIIGKANTISTHAHFHIGRLYILILFRN